MRDREIVKWGCVVFGLAFCVVIVMFIFALLTGLRGVQLDNNGTAGGNAVDCSGVASLTTEQYQWVKQAAGIYLGGDEAQLISLIQVESSWNPSAGNGNALGLGQFMPGTAKGFPEFVGGNDKHGTTWPNPPGQTSGNPLGSPDSRLDAQRSIFATAHYLSGEIAIWGSFGDAYQYGYHGGTTQAQKDEAAAARKHLEDIYNQLKNGGGCVTTTGGSSGMGCGNVPIFKQCDKQWGSKQYGSCSGQSTICSSGCGVTAAAMVLNFYGKAVDPSIMAQESANNGYRACGAGTAHGFFPFIANKYGLQDANNISWDQAMNYLKSGTPVIASGQGPPPFTNGGHFIVLTCLNSDGTIAVNDSDHGSIGSTNYPASLLQSHQHFLTVIHQ